MASNHSRPSGSGQARRVRRADQPPAPSRVRYDVSRLTDDDLHLFNEGTHLHLFDKLGAHLEEPGGIAGTTFAVWAPDAEGVSVIGDFNGWTPGHDALRPRGVSGIWEGFIPDVSRGALYKYHLVSRIGGQQLQKTDPFAAYCEVPPQTASVVWDLGYEWNDAAWMASRAGGNRLAEPITTYEVHLGSWIRSPDDPEKLLGYRLLAAPLADHVERLGFTHVEFLPVMEHPFYGSWGYQTTGYFAPTSRYGTPQDFMFLIDYLHQRGIGVILDWVPSHFPTDAHALGYFDGTHLYEHADARKGLHPDWDSFIFNYGRNEVRSFLLSSALFWLDRYHADGLRVDAVASMLYLDYSRQAGEWIPNVHGGRENLEAISLLRRLNEAVYTQHPATMTIAEESTAWPMVSRPTYIGGLGFGLKWDMGWMHDTLQYMRKDPVHRRFHHNTITFRMLYAFNENFMLPLSHDEVVHGKGSLLAKMPGDDWQKFANLRLLLGYMYTQPGKKLLFMGGEFGQWREWRHDESLDWHLLDAPPHAGLQSWVGRLNALYRQERALHELDCDPAGFEWIDASDADQSVLSFLRKDRAGGLVAVVCNFTPVVRDGYRIGVPAGGTWELLASSDAAEYGGSGYGAPGPLIAEPAAQHGRPYTLELTLPSLACVIYGRR